MKLLQELESFKAIDKDIANAAQNKLRGHLWYLSETNIALAFFDDEVDFETKKKMVLNLNKEGHPDNPKRISLPVDQISSAALCDFVTSNTFIFFDTILNEEITRVTKKFLLIDPFKWKQNVDYLAAKAIVNRLLVVNDIAERGIALITRFNDVLTHQENQKQLVLHAVEQHYKDISSKKFSKQKFVEYLHNKK